ncbi:cell shape-determining protein MreB [Micromonospora sp. DT47]|uniref:cell shape-determining protein MreB n=1 Tax=Micromonospora sp. DT47 TaxID=3393431 RepID=UPI003CF358D1
MPVHVTSGHASGSAEAVPSPSRAPRPTGTAEPDPIAVDLGSAQLRIWLRARGMLSAPVGSGSRTPVMRRGRIVDGPACVAELARLLHDHRTEVPAGALVVACRPVLATTADQDAMRCVLTAVLAPARLLFVDTIRAGAIGAGAAAGTLLLADIGAQLSEVAVLQDGRVVAARRAELGTRDLNHGATPAMLADTVTRLVRELRRPPAVRPLVAAALARGMVVVGDGATRPDLTARLVAALGAPVHRAAAPRTAALTGASLAAVAASQHPAGS